MHDVTHTTTSWQYFAQPTSSNISHVFFNKDESMAIFYRDELLHIVPVLVTVDADHDGVRVLEMI